MRALSEQQVATYRECGFLVIRGIFSADQIADFTKAISTRGNGPISQIPELRDIWTNPLFMEMAGQLLGSFPVYQGDGTCRLNKDKGWPVVGRVLHHDAKGTPENIFNRVHAAQSNVYPVVRFGIYLQDHAGHSGGLKVAVGSHLLDSSAYPANLEYHNVPSEPGDLVCFCLRTLHSPHALRLRKAPDIGLSCRDEDIAHAKSPEDFLPAPDHRGVIFFNYSDMSEFADLHSKNRALSLTPDWDGWTEQLLTDPPQHPIRVVGALLNLAMRNPVDHEALKRVFDMHMETSVHYPFDDLSLLESRIKAYKSQEKHCIRDAHMNWLSEEGHQKLRQLVA